jgi:hypothetical protein
MLQVSTVEDRIDSFLLDELAEALEPLNRFEDFIATLWTICRKALRRFSRWVSAARPTALAAVRVHSLRPRMRALLRSGAKTPRQGGHIRLRRGLI